MAGIGFELRKLMKGDSYSSLLMAYAYAGIISSGPWILSIIAVLLIGVISLPVVIPALLVSKFQTVVTYLIAFSLILTGLVQLAFTRYSADRIFEKEHYRLLPNLNGLLLVVIVVSGVLSYPIGLLEFPQQSLFFRLLFAATFVVLCCVWVTAILLSGLKAYKAILINFALGYGSALLLAFLLRHGNLEGLLLAFLAGQFILLLGMFWVLFREYPSRVFIEFDFLGGGRMYRSLMLTGLFYNLGIWIDKFIFWFHPLTGSIVIGPLRASLVYDLPVFLAYLAIIPGMAVFLVRMETDFVEYYDRFYDAVREGGSLSYIREMKDEMVRVAREGLYDIIKIQAIATIVVIVAGRQLLLWARISEIHLPLLSVQVVATGFQVVLLGLLNVFFYLDKRNRVLLLTALFTVLNLAFTLISIRLGPFYYGYGFALALMMTIAVGMALLDNDLDKLEYETFMLQ
ncbi:exopolysaccharide Pel transporter PelG [Trichlorobacter lovleyi]|uniref:exopolysaccharide Pel transporter PelG n=1 Tax=Trichlorobacter lovleyi TaxID=313985 RepID=UPI002240776C|nr:exopolysaccharide Pel transporter PelG [Trichlorobacter lovleyi]QOX80174.1 exopolysaccharide Pel transporter PelG [Trichlorobacter lovleyi]